MMRLTGRKLALGLGAGVASLGLFGAVALAAFGPDLPGAAASVVDPVATAVLGDARGDKLKDLLDGLVKKGVITQQQEDAIVAALRDAAAGNPRVEAVLRDFIGASSRYLGLSVKELRAKLPGTSLAAIANATPGKDRAGLLAAITTAANADIDAALANKKITDDQAKKLRDALPSRVTTFVDRTWPARRLTAPNVKAFLGDLLNTGRSYLGLPLADIRSQLAAGKSLGDIANATPGKSRDGLVAALTTAANAHIDQAVADKRITAEQGTTLKTKVSAEIATFVDRKAPVRTKPTATATP